MRGKSNCTSGPAPGTRIETTKVIFSQVEDQIRKTIPPEQTDLIMDNIGLTPETFNYAFGDGATISSADGEVLIALNEAPWPHPEIRESSYGRSCRSNFLTSPSSSSLPTW